ncbi:fimbrial protein [Pseudomonas sp. nanlin1]|uniref:fimbrial protein n=1 Tax=Pseudomonas sp. nanlin1 TaxID=3040605 RepID=UPI00388F769B
MKVRMLPLALAAALGVTGPSAFAAVNGSGEVRFEGTITDTGCPIEIVNPSLGSPNAPIQLGDDINKKLFKAAGDTAGFGEFALRINPGADCVVNPGDEIQITFQGAYGATTRNNFSLEPNGATGLGLALHYKTTGAQVKHNVPLTDIAVSNTAPTVIPFTVNYEAEGAAVTVGRANSKITFVVAPN